ncbi:MAG: hypothetical protein AB7S38_09790 [Vulcanimicrobiota bacterium]
MGRFLAFVGFLLVVFYCLSNSSPRGELNRLVAGARGHAQYVQAMCAAHEKRVAEYNSAAQAAALNGGRPPSVNRKLQVEANEPTPSLAELMKNCKDLYDRLKAKGDPDSLKLASACNDLYKFLSALDNMEKNLNTDNIVGVASSYNSWVDQTNQRMKKLDETLAKL